MNRIAAIFLLFVFLLAGRASASVNQGTFRWRNNDGNGETATWRRAENTADTTSSTSPIRLRMELYNNAPFLLSQNISLVYTTSDPTLGTVPWTSVVANPTGAEAWKLANSDYFYDGDPTTQQMTASVASPIGGVMIDSSDIRSTNLNQNNSMEIEFCFEPTAYAVRGTRYWFAFMTGNVVSGTHPSLFFPNTKPVTAALPAARAGTTGYALNGTVDPAGFATTQRFLYGSAPGAYTDSLDALPAPTGYGTQNVSASISGLIHQQTYYYVVSVNSDSGYVRSNEQSFITPPPPSPLDTVRGQALRFDGIDDYVTVDHTAALDFTASDFTIEFWMKTSGLHGIILSKGNSQGSSGFLTVGVDEENRIKLRVGDNMLTTFAMTSTSRIGVDLWNHIAVEMSGGQYCIYINGRLDAAASVSVVDPAAGEKLVIGNDSTGNDAFNGYIDELKIWNTYRTAPQIQNDMSAFSQTLPAGLTTYLQFNEGEDAYAYNIADSTLGDLHNFNFNGASGWFTSDFPTQPAITPDTWSGNALLFNDAVASGQKIHIPNVLKTSDFTIEFWFRSKQMFGTSDQWYHGAGLVDAEVAGMTNDFGTSFGAGRVLFGVGNPDITIASKATLNDSVWHHVAATYARATGAMQLYIDGVLDTAATGATGDRNAPERIVVGGLQTSLNYYNGLLDEVKVWTTVRTGMQIYDDMHAFHDSLQNGMVSYLQFNEGSGDSTYDAVVNFKLPLSAFSYDANDGWRTSDLPLTPLPVELTSFTAAAMRSDAVLTWKTSTETNNAVFDIERRLIASTAWTNVGSLAGNGTTTASHTYVYTDRNLAAGRYAYRLKQIDRSGAVTYSSAVEAVIDAPKAFGLSQNYPNPFNPSTTIEFALPVRSIVHLKIYNAIGQLVAELLGGEREAGYQSIVWNARAASGVYYLRMEARETENPSNRFVSTRKLMLLR